MHRVRSVVVAGLVVAGLLALAAPAAAHVTANPDEAHSQFFKTSFRVGHGCEGSPTESVRIQIPEGLTNVRPQPVPDWEIDIVREELAEPVEGPHGETLTDRVAEVAWTGGPLSDDHHQEFGLSMRLPDDSPEVVYFPVVQECTDGVHRWIEIPDTVEEWGDLEEPAPYVRAAFAGETDQAQDQEAAAEPVADTTGGAEPTGGASLVAWIALLLAAVAVVLGGMAVARGREGPS